jgi:hypothetical protein
LLDPAVTARLPGRDFRASPEKREPRFQNGNAVEPPEPHVFSNRVKDCPLSYAGLTLYGNIDGGDGYQQWGAPLGRSADKPNYGIQKNSAGAERDQHIGSRHRAGETRRRLDADRRGVSRLQSPYAHADQWSALAPNPSPLDFKLHRVNGINSPNRINLYAGLMVSNVSGGIAKGYLHSRKIDPTVGVRFRL